MWSCKRRSNSPSLKRPDFPVAPEQKSGSRYPFALGRQRVGDEGRGALWAPFRYAVPSRGLSHSRGGATVWIDPRTVAKIDEVHEAPPGCVRTKPPGQARSLIRSIAMIDHNHPGSSSLGRQVAPEETAAYGEADLRAAPGRVRLRGRPHDREGLRRRLASAGSRDVCAAGASAGRRDMPRSTLAEAIGVIGGVERKIHFFAFDLPHSDACFVVGYPAETTEAFCDGHVRAFSFFGGVPQSILYDNTKIAVARILGDGKRQRTRGFAELQSALPVPGSFGHGLARQRQGQSRGGAGRLRATELPRSASGLRELRSC